MGSSVTYIGPFSFAGCASLRTVTMPDSVISIASTAFLNCASLTNLTVDPLNPAYSSLDGVLFDEEPSNAH